MFHVCMYLGHCRCSIELFSFIFQQKIAQRSTRVKHERYDCEIVITRTSLIRLYTECFHSIQFKFRLGVEMRITIYIGRLVIHFRINILASLIPAISTVCFNCGCTISLSLSALGRSNSSGGSHDFCLFVCCCAKTTYILSFFLSSLVPVELDWSEFCGNISL